MNTKTHIILLLSLITTLFGCKPEPCQDPTNPECENYDPCYGLEPTSADFYIFQNLGMTAPQGWEDIDEDTILGRGAGVTLQPKYKADKYTWYIGSEILHDEVITRTQLPANEQIPVKLVVENYTSNTTCFPNDLGKDSLTRTLQTGGPLPDGVFYPKWIGTYEGYYDFAPNEKITFTLISSDESFVVANLPYTGCNAYVGYNAGTYSSVSLTLSGSTDLEQLSNECLVGYLAFMHLFDNGDFELKIIGSNSDPSLVGSVMLGKKIN